MDFRKLSAYLNTLECARIPIADVEVRRAHEAVYRKAVGHPDADQRLPVTGNEIYRIYSCSKISLCMGALKLIEEGKISLEDPVSKYLPEFEELNVRDGDVIRPARTAFLVKHCFLMEGGWDYDVFDSFPEPETVKDNITLAAQIAKVPLHFDPGAHYEYGTSQDILGAIIEKITGMSLGEYLNVTFFAPLEMRDTGFHPSQEQRARICALWQYDNEFNTAEHIAGKAPLTHDIELGSAGLISSVSDCAQFMDMIANGGVGANGMRVLMPETVALCRKNMLEGDALRDFRRTMPIYYGYGWGLCGRVHMSKQISLARSPEGEFGWNGAAAAYCLADTDNRLSIYVGMHAHGCNYAYDVIHLRIRDLVYEALEL